MAKSEILFRIIRKWEGGWSDHKNDKGGKTNMGITLSTWKSCGYDKDGDGELSLSEAQADVDEFKALREYNEFLQKQLSEKEQRFVEQTDRLRKVQDELFTLKETNSDLKLELALKRCERKKCGDREPQNGY